MIEGNLIELKLALREIDRKDFRDGHGDFSILFLTCNRDKKIGGEFIRLEKACSCGLPPNCKGHEMRGVKDMITGKKYAVHNRLIYEFDNKVIYWV